MADKVVDYDTYISDICSKYLDKNVRFHVQGLGSFYGLVKKVEFGAICVERNGEMIHIRCSNISAIRVENAN